MIEEHDYHLRLRRIRDGIGQLTSAEDDLPVLEVASPPEFGGSGGNWSPEHLFVASVSGCLMTTFQAIASNSKLDIVDYSDEPSGHLERDDSGRYRMTSVTLRPRAIIADATKKDRAHRLLEKAKIACLISRSLQCDVSMQATVETLEPATLGLVAGDVRVT